LIADGTGVADSVAVVLEATVMLVDTSVEVFKLPVLDGASVAVVSCLASAVVVAVTAVVWDASCLRTGFMLAAATRSKHSTRHSTVHIRGHLDNIFTILLRSSHRVEQGQISQNPTLRATQV
jgi:hypothetical protein